jgi:hydrogenase maturation protease
LLSDEGIGIHVLNALRQQLPEQPGLELLDGGTLSFTLAGKVEQADNLIVVDAARLDEHPGSIKIFENDDMDAFLGRCKCSAHEVGLIDLLDIARLTERFPSRRALVAIQPEKLTWGEQPTETVAGAIPEAVTKVTQLLNQWEVVDR